MRKNHFEDCRIITYTCNRTTAYPQIRNRGKSVHWRKLQQKNRDKGRCGARLCFPVAIKPFFQEILSRITLSIFIKPKNWSGKNSFIELYCKRQENRIRPWILRRALFFKRLSSKGRHFTAKIFQLIIFKCKRAAKRHNKRTAETPVVLWFFVWKKRLAFATRFRLWFILLLVLILQRKSLPLLSLQALIINLIV